MNDGRETYGECTGTPGAATADLAVVTKKVESGLVAERHVDYAMMGERGHGCHCGGLLSASLGGGANEEASVLAPEATGLPLLASVVPEGPPLGREVAVASGNAHKEGIVLLEDGGVADLRDGGVLGRSVHLGQDLLGEGLGDAVEVDLTTGLANALGLSLGEGLDVTIGRVLEDETLVNVALRPMAGSKWLTKMMAILGAIVTIVLMIECGFC